ncbi:MAG: putative Ig domain-containing protein [Nitrospirota bacterium]|nr:putative Ig domain-containing protein [Nitrospirota bacterium]
MEPNQPGVTPDSGASLSGNRPPAIQRAVVFPDPLVLSGPVAAQIEADDPDRDPLTFRYQWFVNGHRVDGETRSTLSPTFLKLGDKVAVEIVAFDGQTSGKPYKTDQAVVKNTPPEVVRVSIEPTGSDRNEMRVVAEAVDVDHDAIRYVYRWRRNVTLVQEGERETLDTKTFSRGDSITVEVIPHDAGGVGKPKLSEPIGLGNNAPKIASQPPSKFEKGIFMYGVQAVDDDKDRLTYALDTAPLGMIIDKDTGMISWPVGQAVTGAHRVRIVVQDGQGGTASQDFDLTLAPSADVKG